jgi:DNA replication protein DnaC
VQRISKSNLLILNDYGLTHHGRQQQLDLMEIIEDWHAKTATIIVSQLPIANWFDIIDEATIADAFFSN